MGYNSAEYQEMQEEEGKGKRIKLNKKGSDYDSGTRYISRKGHREAYQKVADEAQEPETERISKKFKTISVTHYTPEDIKPKSLKIRTAKDTKGRFEGRKAARELKEDILEPEPEVSEVKDNDTIRTVSRALTTRSAKLRDIEDKAYKQQYAKEKGKREAREDTKAERKGQLRAMPVVDRIIETAADTTQKVIDTREKLEDARAKILHTTGRPKKTLANKVPAAQKKTILTAAQKKALQNQVAKAAKNISPKPRGTPFTVERKKLATTKHTLSISQPSPGSITGKSQGNPFGGSRKGNPFGVVRGSMLGSVRRAGNPFEIKKKGWRL